MGRKKRKKTQKPHSQKKAFEQERQQEQAMFALAQEQFGKDTVNHVGYVITTEPLEDEWSRRLPPKLDEQIDSLHKSITVDPRRAIDTLTMLIKRYPEHPILYNFLSVAYGQCGERGLKNEAILACYEKFPTYLYGRINYAQYCLEHGQIGKIPELLGDPPDLHTLCPSRTAFHVSEYAGFARIAGMYYVLTRQTELAKLLYQDVKRIAPRHPATKRLGQVLYPSWWRKGLARLMSRILKRRIARMASQR